MLEDPVLAFEPFAERRTRPRMRDPVPLRTDSSSSFSNRNDEVWRELIRQKVAWAKRWPMVLRNPVRQSVHHHRNAERCTERCLVIASDLESPGDVVVTNVLDSD